MQTLTKTDHGDLCRACVSLAEAADRGRAYMAAQGDKWATTPRGIAYAQWIADMDALADRLEKFPRSIYEARHGRAA